MSETVNRFAGIAALVRQTVETTGRGCETFRLQAAGYSKAFIQEACEAKVLESRRGRTGGIYLFGQVPEAVETVTLKGEAMELLQTLVDSKAIKGENAAKALELLAQYADECARRSEAKKKSA